MDDRPTLRDPILREKREEMWPEKQWQWSNARFYQALPDRGLVISRRKGRRVVSDKPDLKDERGEERKRKPQTIIEGHSPQHGTYQRMEGVGLPDKVAFPKPEGLVEYVFEAATSPGDLVLDSGTTAAVAHKMGRRYIGVEMGKHAGTQCVPRRQKISDGEQGGIFKSAGWPGGGFRFYHLGPTVFDEQARIAGPQAAYEAMTNKPDQAGRIGHDAVAYAPLTELPDVPSVCLHLPTGGGKTLLAAHTIEVARDTWIEKEHPMVLRLVPSNTIRLRTVETLKRMPATRTGKALHEAFDCRVRVFDVADFTPLCPHDLRDHCCVVVGPSGHCACRIPRAARCMLTSKIWNRIFQPCRTPRQGWKYWTTASGAAAKIEGIA